MPDDHSVPRYDQVLQREKHVA